MHRLYSRGRLTKMRVLVLLLVASCSTVLPSIDTTGPFRDPEVASSCTADSSLPGLDTTIAVVAAALDILIVYEASKDSDNSPNVSGTELIAPLFLLGIPAFVFGSSAAHGYLSLRDCRRERAKPLAPTATPPSLVRDLAESARLAARRGDCATARALLERVRKIDKTYYVEVAAGDAALFACARP